MFNQVLDNHHGKIAGRNQTAFEIVEESGVGNDVVGARGVIYQESFATGVGDRETGECVAGAGGSGRELPAGFGGGGRLGHENSVIPALADGDVLKGIVAGIVAGRTPMSATPPFGVSASLGQSVAARQRDERSARS